MNFVTFVSGMKGYVFLRNLHSIPTAVVSYDNGETDQYDKIVDYCKEKSILLLEKDTSFDMKTVDKIFVVGWQYLLKDNIEKLVVFHDSYVPELRGFAPTVTSLLNKSNLLGS